MCGDVRCVVAQNRRSSIFQKGAWATRPRNLRILQRGRVALAPDQAIALHELHKKALVSPRAFDRMESNQQKLPNECWRAD
jgi:hypothetical protein